MTIGICFVVFRTKWVRTLFFSALRLAFTSLEPAMFARMRTDANQKDIYINIYIYIYIYLCVWLSHVAHQHTQRTPIMLVVSFFLSLIIGCLQIVQSIAAVAVRAHCAAHDHQILGATTATPFDTTAPCAPAAIMASRRFWDSSSNVV